MSLGTPYKRFKLEGDYDTIVVGSGIGGLTTAALLARHAGQRVLVLERHYTAGGFTHAFTRPGFEWDVGVHYIGQTGRDGAARRLFEHIGDGRLQWADMGEVYDVIVIDGRRYELVKGKEAFRRKMKSYFPDEARAIDRYLALVERTMRLTQPFFAEKVIPRPLQRVLGGLLRWPALRAMRRTTGEVLAELTDNRELRAVLAGQWGDYGLPPAQSSFFVHATIAAHYLDGAAYPVGGASRIAHSIIPTIEARGGAVLVRAEVSEILVQDGRAVGVRMADGRTIRARAVVSDAGVAITYGRLLEPAVRERYGLSPRVPGVAPSSAHLSLYIGLDRTAAELGLTTANRWIYPGPDHDANVAAFERDPEAPLPVAYLSFPSAKDPEFEQRYPGKATVEVIVPVSYAWFERWQDSTWKRRGEDYEALKRRLSERLLEALVRECPTVAGHVQHAELSTPLTTRHFAGHPHGEMYGLGHNPARFEARWLQPRTPIQGLYLTGADVCMAGVMGAAMGGALAASAMLGRNLLGAALRERPGRAQDPRRAADCQVSAREYSSRSDGTDGAGEHRDGGVRSSFGSGKTAQGDGAQARPEPEALDALEP